MIDITKIEEKIDRWFNIIYWNNVFLLLVVSFILIKAISLNIGLIIIIVLGIINVILIILLLKNVYEVVYELTFKIIMKNKKENCK